ncbi:uncharacterized protein [Palaemon carinicauda]|uniref:uncharacterized protein n=1 Tax=Palaemon carinicauda TaxID=392227 RepID=UPI0035B65A99
MKGDDRDDFMSIVVEGDEDDGDEELPLGDGIRITSLEVPETVDMGEDATLKCCYDLASHDLYSGKWYRDDEEFFRYMPSESPPMATQELNGVSVSKDQSNGDMIVLKNVELNSSGRYKCEVISDAPEFHTADTSAEMMVVGKRI